MAAMVPGWALRLDREGHGVSLWFDKKQSVLTVSGQEAQHRNKELKNRFSREHRKGASCLLQKLDWLMGWGSSEVLGSQGVPGAGDRTKTLPSWSLHSDGK